MFFQIIYESKIDQKIFHFLSKKFKLFHQKYDEMIYYFHKYNKIIPERSLYYNE